MNAAATHIFDNTGDFAAYHAACSYLRARRFSVGAMQDDQPIGILFGTHIAISKWRGMTEAERAALHGTMTGNKRNGPITVTIFASAPAEALAAVGKQLVAA